MASRYDDTPVVSSPFRSGVLRGRELRTVSPGRFLFAPHQVTEGDRIDLLAARYLGDVGLWWVIADANPEVVDWFNLWPGTVIRIPDVLG